MPLYTEHIDSGISRVVPDALGKPIQASDAKGAETLSSYDKLQRPVCAWAKNNNSDSLRMLMFTRYGEEASNPLDHNLLGKPWQQYDEAGKISMPDYDFKSNLLEKTRNVISDATLKTALDNYQAFLVDWTTCPDCSGGLPSILDSFDYSTSSEYDALNRVTKLTLPEDVDTQRKEIIPTYNRAGALEKVIFDNQTYVEHIAYNAKGQRILLTLGNNIMTRYTYDTHTFRLLRQRSEKYVRTHLNGIIKYAYDPGTNKQDYHYQYDLVGNILKITDQSPEAGVGGSASLERNFDYDPLYRLLKATGRENAPLDPMPWDDAYRSQDKTLTTAYTQNYAYDKMGNILKLQHIGNNNFTRNFSYQANSNKLDELQFGSTTLNYNYDPCGNLLNEDASRHNEWDYADRMRCFRIQTPNNEPSKYAQYLYDAEGNRVMKLVRNQGGTWSSIIYIDGIFELLQNSDDEEQSNAFIMDDRSRIAIIRAGDTMGDGSPAVKYNLEDSLGSSMTLLSTNGSFINWEEYYPFGETSLGSYEKKRYRYTGKERDEESGLYYYGARYYAAWTCRFISVDPLAGDFNHQSPYCAMDNNPTCKIDPDGQSTAEPNDPIDPPTVNVGIGINIGTHNTSISFNASISQNIGNWKISAGFEASGYGSFANTGKSGLEFRGSLQGGFNDGTTSISLGTNVFRGLGGMKEFSQRTGILNIGVGKFSASYENDGMPFAINQSWGRFLGDGNDSYRTAAVRLGFGELSTGFNLFTGSRTQFQPHDAIEMSKGLQYGSFGEKMPWGFVQEDGTQYRMGAAFVGYGNTKLGIDSDRWIRHPIQDNWAHNMPGTRQPGFQSLSNTIKPFGQTSTMPRNNAPRFTLYD